MSELVAKVSSDLDRLKKQICSDLDKHVSRISIIESVFKLAVGGYDSIIIDKHEANSYYDYVYLTDTIDRLGLASQISEGYDSITVTWKVKG